MCVCACCSFTKTQSHEINTFFKLFRYTMQHALCVYVYDYLMHPHTEVEKLASECEEGRGGGRGNIPSAAGATLSVLEEHAATEEGECKAEGHQK